MKERKYKDLLSIRHILTTLILTITPFVSKAEGYIVMNPLEYFVLEQGTDEINTEIRSQSAAQYETATLQGSIAAQFNKIREWEKHKNMYLKTVEGYASSLKASTTIFNESLRIFISLMKLKESITKNPQGLLATMSMNNLYMETASEMVSAFTLLNTAVAEGGAQNMLSGAERTETLWAINDRIHSFNQKLQKLVRSIRYYTLNDIWNSATSGIIDKDNATIAREAKERWKRAAKVIQ